MEHIEVKREGKTVRHLSDELLCMDGRREGIEALPKIEKLTTYRKLWRAMTASVLKGNGRRKKDLIKKCFFFLCLQKRRKYVINS